MCYREPVSGFIYMAMSASFPPREPQYKLYCLVWLLFRQTRYKQHVPQMSNTIICRLLLVWAWTDLPAQVPKPGIKQQKEDFIICSEN